ncbi:MAG: PilZ domain-containing protein [Desulfurivibrio sp.]|nr:MAG: PilZ domain-containing protein [Desulfurivibrio sp.]
MQNRERRKNERYRIKSGIAALMLEESSKIAQIVDISTAGLSFVCRRCEVKKNSLIEMDILLLDDIRRPENDIFFPNIPCAVVATSFLAGPAVYALQPMIRCSVRFQDEIPLDAFPIHRFVREKPPECRKKSLHG